jgi:hypothetical protein
MTMAMPGRASGVGDGGIFQVGEHPTLRLRIAEIQGTGILPWSSRRVGGRASQAAALAHVAPGSYSRRAVGQPRRRSSVAGSVSPGPDGTVQPSPALVHVDEPGGEAPP